MADIAFRTNLRDLYAMIEVAQSNRDNAQSSAANATHLVALEADLGTALDELARVAHLHEEAKPASREPQDTDGADVLRARPRTLTVR